MYGVKAVGSRGVAEVVARQSAKDRKESQVLVHMQKIEVYAAIMLGPVFFRTSFLRSGGLSPGWKGERYR